MSNPLADVERLAIHTSDGLGLRAELLGAPADGGGSGGSGRRRALAVLCHPHPLHGGTMHNHVIGGLFAFFPTIGVPAIRFNFRGTSGSEGRHGGGIDERLDVVAAIDAITARYRSNGVETDDDAAGPPLPVLLAGYSFGARVALSVDDPRVTGWFAVAPPLTMGDAVAPAAAGDPRPTFIVTGTRDNFTPAAEVERLTGNWATTTVIGLPGEDHFLATAAASLSAEAEAFVDLLSPV